jgi:hypothetical protein
LNLVFTSKAMKDARPALEELFFFNPRQYRVREGIVSSLGQFGHPRIEDKADGLSIRVGNQEAQTLFAFDGDRSTGNPIGVVIFIRTDPAEMAILHLAVHPDYALPGHRAGLGLALVLIEKVREIASRIVGIQRIILHYQRDIVIRVR